LAGWDDTVIQIARANPLFPLGGLLALLLLLAAFLKKRRDSTTRDHIFLIS